MSSLNNSINAATMVFRLQVFEVIRDLGNSFGVSSVVTNARLALGSSPGASVVPFDNRSFQRTPSYTRGGEI